MWRGSEWFLERFRGISRDEVLTWLLTWRFSRLYSPFYQKAFSAVKSDPSALWLEAGCAFGTDVRRLVLDGWPAKQVFCLDVHDGYWKYGLKLYGDGPDAPEGKRLECETAWGNILDDKFFSPKKDPAVPDPLPRDAFSVVSLSAVLHVLAKEDSEGLLQCLHDYFIKPGGYIFGSCVGTGAENGEHWWETPDGSGRKRFLYSEKALAALLEKLGFVDVEVCGFERAERAGLESRAPRVVTGKEKEALSQVGTYLIFSAKKK